MFITTFRGGNTTPEWATERIVDVGLPVDRIEAVTLERNEKGREYWLGSWTFAGEKEGTFSIYELLDRHVPEKQLGTIVHEGAHANTPFNERNTFIFGSEEARQEAAEFAESLAQQTLDTGTTKSAVHLNQYHQSLHERFITGEIDRATFNEETWAIASELALTNRKHLEQVQAAQHAAIDRRIGGGILSPDYKKVQIISSQKGSVVGIDKALINLIDDVKDFDGLIAHVDGLKAKFYPDASLTKATRRGTSNGKLAMAA